MQTILKAVFGCLMTVRGWKDFSDNTDPKAKLRSIRMQSQIATLDAHRQNPRHRHTREKFVVSIVFQKLQFILKVQYISDVRRWHAVIKL